MKRGKEKLKENYVKNGEKGLKNASFWVINSTNFDSPAVGRKNNLKRIWEEMIETHNKYPCWSDIRTIPRINYLY